jgi:hypothetical protein
MFERRLILLAAGLLLAGCDQSVTSSGAGETQLTGMHCDEKPEEEQRCRAGDVIVTAEGREQLVCDWGWQIVHEPDSDEILCVYRGQPREGRDTVESVK